MNDNYFFDSRQIKIPIVYIPIIVNNYDISFLTSKFNLLFSLHNQNIVNYENYYHYFNNQNNQIFNYQNNNIFNSQNNQIFNYPNNHLFNSQNNQIFNGQIKNNELLINQNKFKNKFILEPPKKRKRESEFNKYQICPMDLG